MTKPEVETQALKALKCAAGSGSADEAKTWLEVAAAWYAIHSGMLSQEDLPDVPTGFIEQLPEMDNEEVRLLIRINKDGKAMVICDPRFKQAEATEVNSASEAAGVAMELLDRLKS